MVKSIIGIVFQRPVSPVYFCKNTLFDESKAFFQHCKSFTGTNSYLEQWRWQFGCPAALKIPIFWTASALVFKENKQKKKVRLVQKKQHLQKKYDKMRWPRLYRLNRKYNVDKDKDSNLIKTDFQFRI